MSSKELPEGWCWGQVGTVSNSIQYGYTASASKEPIGPQMLRITDIQNNKVNWDSVPYCSINPKDKGKYLLRDGDLVFARTGATVGKSFLIKGKIPESVYASYLIRIRLSKNISDKYLYLFFQSVDYWRQITEGQVGIGQPNVNGTKLSRLFFPIAPLPEQHQIVARLEELFSDLDDGIASLKKAQEQLKTYRQAVLKYAFEGKLTVEWRKQHHPESAETLLKQIKTERERQYQHKLDEWQQTCEQTTAAGKKKPPKPKKPKDLPPLTEAELAELPELPEGWCYIYLAYIGKLGRGKSKHRPRNDPKLFGGKYPFVQTGEIKAAEGVLREFSQTYNEIGLQQSKLWPVGTLCITIAANIADTVFLGIEACFPDSVVGFSGYKTIINSKYVDYFIQSVKTKIEAFAPATAQKNINLATLENLLIPYCSLEEQNVIINEIESRLSVCDQLEQTIADSLQKAESLRQSILKQTFEGKLTEPWRKAHPNLISGEHSAAALLERIQAEKKALETKKTSKQMRLL